MESNKSRESGIFHREQLFWTFVHSMFVIGCWTSGSAVTTYFCGAWHSAKTAVSATVESANAQSQDDVSPEMKALLDKQTAWLKLHPMPEIDDSFDGKGKGRK